MIFDNFNTIEQNLLNFTNDDCYYKFEAIIRSKDGENALATNPNSTSLKYWLIDSEESYQKLKPVMKKFCDVTGARLYVALDKKSLKKTFVNTLKTFTEVVCDITYGVNYSVQKLNKVIASETSKKENTANKLLDNNIRTWMIDVDTKISWIVEAVKDFCQDNYICSLETPNGFHIITKKNFGKDRFKDCLETHLIHQAGKYAKTQKDINTYVKVALDYIGLKENALGLVYRRIV